ncbi:MAG: hypothetical protein HY001_04010 [Candidatus Portnoybacteria bacterium]|nr:hypothetical protein [Candidatus Portnoybacteria bacterium]
MRERKINNLSWISIIKPNRDDVEEIREHFPQVHHLIIENLVSPTLRPHVENYDGHIYMVLHFPQFIKHEHRVVANEIDFILMPQTLITVQYETIDVLENFWHECGSGEVAHEYGKTPIHLLYYLLRQFFGASLQELDAIQNEIDLIEDKIFSGDEKEILQNISILKRNILDFRRAVKPEHLTLESLRMRGEDLYGLDVRPYLSDIISEYLRVWNLLENHKETIDALYETNSALLNARTNSSVLAFTVLAFTTFVPMTIAAIFGMNLHGTPFAENPNAFWHAFLIICVFTALIFLILKEKKLL